MSAFGCQLNKADPLRPHHNVCTADYLRVMSRERNAQIIFI
jgi:hypothetical protein